MIEAITQCPECQTSFRVTEAQLRIAEGSVRCGACLHVFQAEDYLLSPLLDMTERLAIEQDYWLDFEDYMAQVAPVLEPAVHEGGEEPSAAPAAHEEKEPSALDSDVMSFWLEYIDSHATPIAAPTAPAESPSGDEHEEPSAAPAAVEELGLNERDLSVVDGESLFTDGHKEPSAAPAAVEELGLGDRDLSVVDGESLFTDGHKEPSALPGLVDRDLQAVDGESPFVDGHEKAFDLEFEPDPELLFQDRRRFFPFASLKWVPGILFMLLLLGAQWAFMNLQTFAQNEAYREQILAFCRVTGCSVPDYDKLEFLETRELIIRSHPEAPSALMVDVLLRNSGDFRQVFPGLRLDFMEVRGNVVASRVFRSADYLGGEMRGLRYIPALTEVRLSLEIVDPGEKALGYQMEVVRL